MEKIFNIDNIKALDNFKKLSKLGWSIVSTQRQLKNNTIVVKQELHAHNNVVVFFKYPYIVDGYSKQTADGKAEKYTRNQQYLKEFATKGLSEEDYFINAFDYFINTYHHHKPYLISKVKYAKFSTVTESDKVFIKTVGDTSLNYAKVVYSKLSTVDHMLEFDNNFQGFDIHKDYVQKDFSEERPETLHISMSRFNELVRFYDNIIFKGKSIRLGSYNKHLLPEDYSETHVDYINEKFAKYDEEFSTVILDIKETVNENISSCNKVNYHKPKIKKPEDLWIIVNDKMKGYKEHLAKIKNYKDYRFFKEIVNILDVKILTDIRAFQLGDQFGFFED